MHSTYIQISRNLLTTWHEHLKPTNLNVFNGKLYIVGVPQTTVEFISYKFPRPPYVGYVFEQKGWRRIPFNEIPEAIYTMNLSYLDNHDDNSRPLTLSEKEKHSTANVRDADTKSLMIHINPSYKFPNDEAYRH